MFQDVFDHLQTPGNNPQQGQGAETPLSEVIERNLTAAVANSKRSHVTNLAAMTASPQLGKEPEPEVHTHTRIYTRYVYLNYRYLQVCVLQVEQKTAAPLRGVVVCVSKKLSKKQSELNAVAASLGADFRYVTNRNI